MTPFISGTWSLVAGGVVLILPGLAWLAFFLDADQDPFERLAEVLGISISATAVVALFAYLLGWHLGSAAVVGIYLVLLLPAIWGCRRWWEASTLEELFTNPEPVGSELGEDSPHHEESFLTRNQGKLAFLALILIFLVILIWRFHQIQGVVLPLWVDSVHHVQIVDLFLETGGIPETFEPYMPVPFYYHYAFHASAALFSFISRLPPAKAVLFLGQALNAAVALGVYRLGKALWGGWRRAALSAILVGLVTQMPAYYVTWGRYTLLTGMLLLPLCMATALDIVNKGVEKSRLFTFALLTAGTLLSHYFAAGLLAIFLVILGIQVLFSNILRKNRPVWSTWLPLLIAALAGLIIAGPWLYRMWGFAQRGVELGAFQPTLEAINERYFPDYLTYLWRLLGPDRNQALLFIALPGLVISLLRRQTRVFGVWSLVLALMSLPAGFYVAPFRPDHAVIVLFLPTAMLVAELLVSIIDLPAGEKLSMIKGVGMLVVFVVLVGWGIFDTRDVINSTTILATQDDLQALNWIEENTPLEAVFGINAVHWQYGSYRGVDGGWWITPLTGRMTSLPNALSTMGTHEYALQVNEIARQFSNLTGCTPEFWELAQAQGLTHVYVTAQKGSMQPDQFEDCPGAELVFHNESVYIYRIEYIIQ